MSVPVGDSQALDEVGRVREVSEDEPALDLGALKALCAAASPGPWFVSPDALWHVRTVLENAITPLAVKDGEPIADATLDSDAAFIAAARSALPALIAEVERLTVERDRARDIACHLEQQNAEALRVAQEAVSRDKLLRTYRHSWALLRDALGDIVRILGDETENQ